MNDILKSFKVRLYPTKEQELRFIEHINVCRFVWNYMLGLQEGRDNAGVERLSCFETMNLLTKMKKEDCYTWMNNVACASMQTICRDLDKAYTSAYKKTSKFPKFKKKNKSKKSFPVGNTETYFKDSNFVKIPVIGFVKCKTDFIFPYGRHAFKIYNPRITLKNNGKWILTFSKECESQAFDLNDFNVGIDLGVKETMVVAYNDKKIVFHNIVLMAKRNLARMNLKK